MPYSSYSKLGNLIELDFSASFWSWVRMVETWEFLFILMLITRGMNFRIIDSWVLFTVIAHILYSVGYVILCF